MNGVGWRQMEEHTGSQKKAVPLSPLGIPEGSPDNSSVEFESKGIIGTRAEIGVRPGSIDATSCPACSVCVSLPWPGAGG